MGCFPIPISVNFIEAVQCTWPRADWCIMPSPSRTLLLVSIHQPSPPEVENTSSKGEAHFYRIYSKEDIYNSRSSISLSNFYYPEAELFPRFVHDSTCSAVSRIPWPSQARHDSPNTSCSFCPILSNEEIKPASPLNRR